MSNSPHMLSVAAGTVRFDRVVDDHPLRPIQRGAWRVHGSISLSSPLRFDRAQFLGMFTSALAPMHSRLLVMPPALRDRGQWAPGHPLVESICRQWCRSTFPIDAPGTLIELAAAGGGLYSIAGYTVERVPARLARGADHFKMMIQFPIFDQKPLRVFL